MSLNWNFLGRGGGGGCKTKTPPWGLWVFSGTAHWSFIKLLNRQARDWCSCARKLTVESWVSYLMDKVG